MSLDSICLSGLRSELDRDISGMRIDKVQQPQRDQIILSLRGMGKNLKLLLSANVGSARVNITSEGFENPAVPPMFCMLLRKQLTGAKIVLITQPQLERVLDIELDALDALGYECKKHIVFEAMGKYSNIILTDGEMRIIDCIRRIEGNMTDARIVLPGLIYRLPPSQGKRDPNECDGAFVRGLIAANEGTSLQKLLLNTFTGFSPLISRELALRICGSTDGICSSNMADRAEEVFEEYRTMLLSESFRPVIIKAIDGSFSDFSYMDIRQYGTAANLEFADGFSVMLDKFYSDRDKADRMKQRSLSLMKSVKTAYDRLGRKLGLQKAELLKTADRDYLRKCGDIITANLYRMKKGERTLTAQDFYSESYEDITIKLDHMKTPQQNAAKYYKDYSKAKNAEKYLTEQILQGESDYTYLASVIDEIERAETERDISEIRQELEDSGFLRPQNSGKKVKHVEAKPMHFVSSTGFDIYVGRNNTQNDKLTLKTAQRYDMWLHAQKIHGSHVIIASNGNKIDEQTIVEAASLAAYYSKGRNGNNVPVDYTEVRYVKKPSGAKPGMVIYTDYSTVFVKPKENI